MAEKKKCCNNSSCLALLYDVLGQVISILDVTTDIIVCVQYYQKDRMVFFGISLTILCLALFAYDFIFMVNHSRESSRSWKNLALFMVMLLISPLIPFLMYFLANPDSKVGIVIKEYFCFDIKLGSSDQWNEKDKSRLKKFMRQKVSQHLGFIVEALVEGIYACTLIFHSLLSMFI